MTMTDDALAQLDDRATEELPEPIRGVWTLDSDDRWGDNLGHWFAINAVATVMGWPTHPEYKPGAGLDRDALMGEYPDHMYMELAETGQLTAEHVVIGNDVMSRYDHACRLAGLDY